MSCEVRVLAPHEAAVLERVAPGVFDNEVDPQLTAEFFADPRHHLAVAIEDGVVVGMASAIHYLNPDKPPQLFINEVGVAPSHQGRGFGRQLVETLVRLATELQCTEAWVLTDSSNVVAQRIYEGAGGETPPAQCIMYTIRIVPAVVGD